MYAQLTSGEQRLVLDLRLRPSHGLDEGEEGIAIYFDDLMRMHVALNWDETRQLANGLNDLLARQHQTALTISNGVKFGNGA